MLQLLPNEILTQVLDGLHQRDKCSLSLVSHSLYEKIIPFLYQNLYLNERPCVFLPEYPFFGNNWSTLAFSESIHSSTAFESLLNSLSRNRTLCHYINRIHCTWHLNRNLLQKFTKLICDHGTNVTYFENFVYIETLETLSKSRLSKQLRSLDIVPHSKLPGSAYASYLTSITSMANKFDWANIRSLNIYIDALMWFPKFVPLSEKLQIDDLCLNLRRDSFPGITDTAGSVKFSDIFDVNALQKLSILSWYETELVDVYERYGLFDLCNFKNIKEVALLSLFYNERFLIAFLSKLSNLKTLKLDFMFDHVLSNDVLDVLSRTSSLQYLDCKFDDYEDPILQVIELDSFAIFELTQSCLCEHCNRVFRDILVKKYFPNKNAFMIHSADDIHARHFLNHILKLYPIIPYFHILTTSPCIAYRSRSITELTKKSNEILHDVFYDYELDTSANKITEDDIVDIFHCICHSMRRTFDHFLQLFPNLSFLIINDVPTIVDNDKDQRFMKPLFFSSNYITNQVHEIVQDESLFD